MAQSKRALPLDCSPRLNTVRSPASSTEHVWNKKPALGTFVFEEDENIGAFDGQNDALGANRQNIGPDTLCTDYRDCKAVPMYQEVFEGLRSGFDDVTRHNMYYLGNLMVRHR